MCRFFNTGHPLCKPTNGNMLIRTTSSIPHFKGGQPRHHCLTKPFCMSLFNIFILQTLLTFLHPAPTALAQSTAKQNPIIEKGRATTYPDSLSGKTTASGIAYNPDAFTIAHRIYPFKTKLVLVNPATKDTLHVVVNDRVGAQSEHDYWLTPSVAERLDITSSSTLNVIAADVYRPLQTDKLVSAPRRKTYEAVGKAAGKAFQTGGASFYGNKFNGRRTASGQRFSNSAFTAAHRTLPFGTMVRVVNPRNGRSVVVRINDRGPFVRGRVIDLSSAAARKLGIGGVGTVHLYRLDRNDVVELEETLDGSPVTEPLHKPDGTFTIQVFNLQDTVLANRALSLAEGFWLESTTVGNSTMSRINYKRFGSEKEAQIALAFLQLKGFDGFVKQLPPEGSR